jgi:hypothetical protein
LQWDRRQRSLGKGHSKVAVVWRLASASLLLGQPWMAIVDNEED